MILREIQCEQITNAVRDAVIKANIYLPESLQACIEKNAQAETKPLAKNIFCDMCKNMQAADELQIPVCQDTGMAVIFCEIGQEVHLVGGDFEAAINEGVRQGYTEGFLRKSIVADPLRRVNTNDNTPAVIHARIVAGDKLALTVAPKGFGSENMSKMKMFNPTVSPEMIMDFVVDVVRTAGSNPCPPVVVGVGIGGDFEYAAVLSKKALCRDIDKPNADVFYADMEKQLLDRINALGIGCQGFGGDVTALGVNIETFPTHIAGLPVAVNIGCHVTRHVEVVL